MKIDSVNKKVVAVAGILMGVSQLSAQTISWGSTAVPMSMTTLIVLAIMFMIGGTWVLSRAKKHVQQFAVAMVLVAGLYNYSGIAIAEVSNIDITTRSGTAHLTPGVINLVCNKYAEDVVISGIDPDGYMITESSSPCAEGTVLTPISVNEDNACCTVALLAG